MPRLYDISLPIREDMLTYPGDPPPELSPHASIDDGDDANVTSLSFGSHTGTHLDAALHFIPGGQSVDELSLERLIGPALVVRIPDEVQAIGAEELRAAGVEQQTRVLLKTRNSDFLSKSDFQKDFAYLTRDGAEFLLEAGVELIAIDYLSIEDFDADEPIAHKILLEREVIVVEGVDLREVPPGRYELLCLPIKIAGIDGAPVRAVLREVGDT
jgi:arylformamidase